MRLHPAAAIMHPSAAAQINLGADGTVTAIHLGVGSIGDFPERRRRFLLSTDLTDAALSAAVTDAIAMIDTVDDLHASASYRKRVGTALAIRALRDARNSLYKDSAA